MVNAIDSLDLERVSDTRFIGQNVKLPGGRPIFGGQMLGQAVMVGHEIDPAKKVRSVQVAFPRAGDPGTPLTIDAEILHAGRTMSTLVVRMSQGTRTICHAIVLLDSEEKDVMRHGEAMPEVGTPDEATANQHMSEGGGEIRLVGGVDLDIVEANGEAELLAWVRWPDVPPSDPARNVAIAAWYTDSLIIGASMRPHEGIGGHMAHEQISTGVLTHTISFHDDLDASRWQLVANRANAAANGRVYGTGNVFADDGRHVASFSQVGMVRWFPEFETRRGAGVM
jgi:acyl-CoA thioesterase II